MLYQGNKWICSCRFGKKEQRLGSIQLPMVWSMSYLILHCVSLFASLFHLRVQIMDSVAGGRNHTHQSACVRCGYDESGDTNHVMGDHVSCAQHILGVSVLLRSLHLLQFALQIVLCIQ